MGLPIGPGTYPIDTNHSQLGFSVGHLGISALRGTFDRYQGALVIGDALDDVRVSIEAEMASINSGNRARDEHMFGPDWLDVEQHPTMRFESRAVESDGDDSSYRLHGDLTIRGVTQPVVLDVTFNGSNVFPMDRSTHFGFTASGAISRSAFGVSFGVPMVSDDVELNLALQFIAPAPVTSAG